MSNDKEQSYVDMGMQAGDKAAHQALAPLHRSINRALSAKCSRGYGKKLKDLGFVLRVDGEIGYWEKVGCDNVAGRRAGTATVDIFMSNETWQGVSTDELKRFLSKHLREGFVLMLDKLKHLGVEFDEKNLASDFDEAIRLFENTEIP
ncbi:hypothetical protein ACFDR9_000439 [Janthinobacterium sp. CG_23.3]|uniref:hypothetical protein n=1 Tax=Janthinobacterium sp. CG_23.3 TaxID=3349634 RepID=UPI0038D472B5